MTPAEFRQALDAITAPDGETPEFIDIPYSPAVPENFEARLPDNTFWVWDYILWG